MLTVGGQDLCRVHVRPSKFPIEATVTHATKGEHEQRTAFFYRFGNSSKAVPAPGQVEKLTPQIGG